MKNIKKMIMIFFIITISIITFNSKYNSLIKEFESTAKSRQTNLNDHIQLSSNFIDDITMYGNNFFKHNKNEASEIYTILKYNSTSNYYNLDAVGGTEYEETTGNLTGLGSITENGLNSDDVNLALHYNEFFSKFYNRLPDVAWIYYTSENNFINIYPWIASEDFEFTKELKDEGFYRLANPQNNPLHKSIWTPAYLDHAGKGIMVTLSSPIYDKDTFKGVVSLDLTTKKLSDIINSEYESYLIDDTNSVIATSQDIVFNEDVIKLSDLLKNPESEIKKIKEAEKNSVQMVGNYYIYNGTFSYAPWEMLIIVPIYSIVGKSALFTLPILIICFLLLVAVNAVSEIELHKRTEKILKNIAITDQLTGLNNRHSLDKKVLEEMNRSDRYNRPLSMIIFDLDHFKHVNDTWGHPIGDEVLKQTAEITSSLIRKTDMMFRLGGEEFVILLPETTISCAKEVAEKLRVALDTTIHPVVGKFTASFGVAERLRDESFNNWYKNVDQALYYAKNRGRNRVFSYLELEVITVTIDYII